MAAIRSDLVGAIYAGGHVLTAGDQVPSGIALAPAHLAPAPKPAKKAPAKRAKKADEPDERSDAADSEARDSQ